jgi:hypothetical protein
MSSVTFSFERISEVFGLRRDQPNFVNRLKCIPKSGCFVLLLALAAAGFAQPAAAQQTLFTNQTPVITGASGANELGMKFQSSEGGTISAIRYWKDASEPAGGHVGKIWSSAGSLLASTTFVNETASGWQQQALTSTLTVQANTTYVVSVNDVSHYVATNSGPYFPILNTDPGLFFPIVNGALPSLADGSSRQAHMNSVTTSWMSCSTEMPILLPQRGVCKHWSVWTMGTRLLPIPMSAARRSLSPTLRLNSNWS